MRITDYAGVYHMIDQISPEAFKAQRQAELEQLARYRAVRIEQYKAWADPVQREQIQANAKIELQKSNDFIEGKTVWLSPLRPLGEILHISEPYAPKGDQGKRPWRSRWKSWRYRMEERLQYLLRRR